MGWWILLRLLFAALIIRLIWKFVAGAVSGAAGPRPRRTKRGVALVRDPVCGTYVEPSRAIRIRAGGMTHYFCSQECRRSFVKTA
ncbi:MAG: YHS domain-containing protein [Acidobacteria bacterium]|nr:YHS domain-containing protein [Acidobacteriota bacterium]